MHRLSLLLGVTVVASRSDRDPPLPAPPNDPLYGPSQWGPKQIRAEQAWTTSRGAGQVIAIVDAGSTSRIPTSRRKIVGGATFTGCAATGPCGNGDWQSGGSGGQPAVAARDARRGHRCRDHGQRHRHRRRRARRAACSPSRC